jgi:formate-dependent nitrite reductase membrane component NrfD
MPEHLAAAPGWGWWIIAYFFFGGITGGSYAIGTLIRRVGSSADQPIARRAFIVSFFALLVCPVFLVADLGVPVRFLNLFLDASEGGFVFKYWTPISVGAWALLIFGVFSFVSFLGALGEGRSGPLTPVSRMLSGGFGFVWTALGTLFGLFIAGYTGVLLAASNVAVWADAGWVLGGLFLASGLAGSAALLLILGGAGPSAAKLETADRNFALVEAALVVLFLVSVAVAGTIGRVLGVWLLLWLLVALGIAAPLIASRMGVARRWPPTTTPVLTLLGVLALRALVVFSAQS